MTSNRLLSATATLSIGLLLSTAALADSIQPLGTDTFAELKAGFEGTPFVVSLWSVDCLPCRVELELLGELKKQDPQFPLLLISTDVIESPMALHPDFPASPYAELVPEQRWFPAAEELRGTAYEKLLPPLVVKIRIEVSSWRDSGYAGASATSIALLKWWFETQHLVEQADGTQSGFRYYFSQRAALETLYGGRDSRDCFQDHAGFRVAPHH